MGWYISGRPSLRLADVIRREKHPQSAYPMNQTDCSFFFSGRYALAAAIKELGLSEGDRILVPSYNCGVELDPLLEHKLELLFYNVQKSCVADLADLSGKCAQKPKAVLVTHYLGFPQPIEEIRDLCRRRELLIIEDCAHAFLSTHGGNPLGSFGHAAIFSLLKTLPVATGGILVLNGRTGPTTRNGKEPRSFPVWYFLTELCAKRSFDDSAGGGDRADRLASAGLLVAMKGLKTCIAATRKVSHKGGDLLVRPDGFTFEGCCSNWGASKWCRRIIERANFEEIRTRRRRNYTYLLANLKLDEKGEALFPNLPEGVCPLFFPVLVEDKRSRDRFHRILRNRGVVTHPWWDRFRPEVPWDAFPDAVFLKERMMGFPIHQDLGERELNRVIEEFGRL